MSTPTNPSSSAAAPVTLEVTPGISTATQRQKVAVTFLLWGMTALVGWAWFATFDKIEKQIEAEHIVEWIAPTNTIIVLQPGPPLFRYDRTSNMLFYKGVIDAPIKQELIALFPSEGTNKSEQAWQSYSEAVSSLAYKSNDGNRAMLSTLLFLGGLSSMLGAMLRLAVNFINVTCYKKTLDLKLWWPYYALRPPLAFMIGLTIVLLAKANFLLKDQVVVSAGSLWWAAIALLAGFGASEFTDRLILVVRTLFGEGDIRSTSKT